VGGFFRVFVTHGNLQDSVAIATSLLLIVLASVLLGTALPFALVRLNVDPAHAGSSIQVDNVFLSRLNASHQTTCRCQTSYCVAFAEHDVVLPLHEVLVLCCRQNPICCMGRSGDDVVDPAAWYLANAAQSCVIERPLMMDRTGGRFSWMSSASASLASCATSCWTPSSGRRCTAALRQRWIPAVLQGMPPLHEAAA
jgi:hypothetical protein